MFNDLKRCTVNDIPPPTKNLITNPKSTNLPSAMSDELQSNHDNKLVVHKKNQKIY